MRPWLIAGAAGLVALAVLLPRQHAAPWSREQAIVRAQELARQFGWDIRGWDTAVSASSESHGRRVRQAFPDSPLARRLPEVRYRVHAREETGDATFRAEFGESGQLLRLMFQGAKPAPELKVEQLPALFAPDRAALFREFKPGASPRPERRFSTRRQAGRGDTKGRGGPMLTGGRPEWEWVEGGESPLVLRIFSMRPEGQLRGARMELELTRALRMRIAVPGEGLRDGMRGFGVLLVVMAMIAAGWRVLGQIGVRRDYLRVLFSVWVTLAAGGLILFLAGGPGAILRTEGLRGDETPGSEGFGVLFGLLVGRPLALALPLAAGFLTIRGRHVKPWLGLLSGVLRRALSRGAARGIWAGVAVSPVFAALPYVVVEVFRGGAFVARPGADLLAQPAPAFELLRRFPVEILGGVCLFALALPWMMRAEQPSKLRRVLFGLAGVLMLAPRVDWIDGNGWAAAALPPLWLAASWVVLRGADLTGLLAAWLAASALPVAGIYLMDAPRFPVGIAQTLALAALPALAAWWGLRRAPMSDEEQAEFEAEIQRRNHPDTAPRLRSEREHLLNEFALAREAQEGMLPARPPETRGYSLAACCVPAREVGGDLFDFLHLPDGRLGLCVADVSGKGVPAALYMTLTKGMLAAEHEMGSGARELARALNRQLLAAGQRRTFVTLLLALLEPDSGRVEMIRAGHNPALWWRSDQGEGQYLMPRGIGLGLAQDLLFDRSLDELALTLEPGDVLVLYSDGLTEAMDRARDFYGEDRLYRAVAANAHLDAPALMEALLDELKTFTAGQPAHDDLTLLIAKRRNGGAEA